MLYSTRSTELKGALLSSKKNWGKLRYFFHYTRFWAAYTKVESQDLSTIALIYKRYFPGTQQKGHDILDFADTHQTIPKLSQKDIDTYFNDDCALGGALFYQKTYDTFKQIVSWGYYKNSPAGLFLTECSDWLQSITARFYITSLEELEKLELKALEELEKEINIYYDYLEAIVTAGPFYGQNALDKTMLAFIRTVCNYLTQDVLRMINKNKLMHALQQISESTRAIKSLLRNYNDCLTRLDRDLMARTKEVSSKGEDNQRIFEDSCKLGWINRQLYKQIGSYNDQEAALFYSSQIYQALYFKKSDGQQLPDPQDIINPIKDTNESLKNELNEWINTIQEIKEINLSSIKYNNIGQTSGLEQMSNPGANEYTNIYFTCNQLTDELKQHIETCNKVLLSLPEIASGYIISPEYSIDTKVVSEPEMRCSDPLSDGLRQAYKASLDRHPKKASADINPYDAGQSTDPITSTIESDPTKIYPNLDHQDHGPTVSNTQSSSKVKWLNLWRIIKDFFSTLCACFRAGGPATAETKPTEPVAETIAEESNLTPFNVTPLNKHTALFHTTPLARRTNIPKIRRHRLEFSK